MVHVLNDFMFCKRVHFLDVHCMNTMWTSYCDVLWSAREHTVMNCPFSSDLDKLLKNSTPEEIVYIWKIKWVQIDAEKFEGTHVYFLATFSLPSSSLLKFSIKAMVFQELMLYVLLVLMNRILVKLMLSRGIIKSLKYGTSVSVKRSKSGTTTSGCFLKKKRKKHWFIMRKFCINGS